MSELKAYCPYANRDGFYHKSEADKVIAHSNYKRCLAIARWCCEKWADIATPYGKSVWYRKWEKRWLELAEKFKEAK